MGVVARNALSLVMLHTFLEVHRHLVTLISGGQMILQLLTHVPRNVRLLIDRDKLFGGGGDGFHALWLRADGVEDGAFSGYCDTCQAVGRGVS